MVRSPCHCGKLAWNNDVHLYSHNLLYCYVGLCSHSRRYLVCVAIAVVIILNICHLWPCHTLTYERNIWVAYEISLNNFHTHKKPLQVQNCMFITHTLTYGTLWYIRQGPCTFEPCWRNGGRKLFLSMFSNIVHTTLYGLDVNNMLGRRWIC